MKSLLSALILIGSFAQPTFAACESSFSDIDLEVCPTDLQEYIHKVESCGYFMSEPYPTEEELAEEPALLGRKEFLDKQISELGCSELDGDKAALIEKYNDDKPISDFLREYEY